jgi:16S rRNA (uracil1498-N3)-methyltransferase
LPHIFYGKQTGDFVILDEHESRHLRVIRVSVGQKLFVTDGKGNLYNCELIELGKLESKAVVRNVEQTEINKLSKITLCIASQNWERLRFLLEKAVELGVDELIIYKTKRSKLYIDKEEKIRLIIRDAAKQSVRYLFPELRIFRDMSFLQNESMKTVVLHQSGRAAKIDDFKGSLRIVVGPEGDFESEEINQLSQVGTFLNLGKKILRFETAAILAAGLSSFLNGKI